MKLQQHLENCLLDWARISGLDYCILDAEDQVFVKAGHLRLPSAEKLQQFRENDALCTASPSGALYKLAGCRDCLLIIGGHHDHLPTLGELAVCQIQSLFQAYAEKNDRQIFLQNLLTGSLSPQEIMSRARQFRIQTAGGRVVYLIEPKSAEGDDALATIRNIFSARTKDYVLSLDHSCIAIIRELLSTDNQESISQTAHMLVDMLGAEAMLPARVAYSKIVSSLDQLPDAYRQAKAAMETGKIFYAQSSVFGYEKLGIGRLIYQLPEDICELFVQEVFGNENPDALDDETLSTIRILFENNLNISETARQLYVHRNTLVYRFEKLQKKFNLDVRNFEDAVAFKLAMMVVEYLRSMKQQGSVQK